MYNYHTQIKTKSPLPPKTNKINRNFSNNTSIPIKTQHHKLHPSKDNNSVKKISVIKLIRKWKLTMNVIELAIHYLEFFWEGKMWLGNK
jgi:hypothetical protein